jgi:hypothetical protein
VSLFVVQGPEFDFVFSKISRPVPGPTQPSIQRMPGIIFPEKIRPELELAHSLPI